MTAPAQKPGRSVQDVQTPPEFIEAVSERFGYIDLDLAATAANAVVPHFFGPDSPLHEDALAPHCKWLPPSDGLLWLNPPFANITPWATKCVTESEAGASIALLVPASVGSNWFNNYVRPYAYVLELAPRIKFVGHTASYPKDLILAIYTPERFVGREAWHWRRAPRPANDNAADPRQLLFPSVPLQ